MGLDAWRDAVEVHRRVGYLPGEPAMYGRLTGRQHVSYFRHLRRDADNKRAVLLANRLDLDLDRPARELSKGNRQKLAVVLAMMSGPELLILDEPTSGLDPIVQQEFHALLREQTAAGGSVLLSSHVLSEVQRVADRIGVVRSGRLIAVERMADLRAKSLHHVGARFGDEVSEVEFAVIAEIEAEWTAHVGPEPMDHPSENTDRASRAHRPLPVNHSRPGRRDAWRNFGRCEGTSGPVVRVGGLARSKMRSP